MTRPLAMAVAASLLSACSLPTPQAQFDEAASKVLRQLDAADYQAIYEEASDVFQAPPESSEAFAEAMDENRHKLGRCWTPKKLGPSRTVFTQYGFVSVQDYGRACANGPTTIELSTVKRQGQAKLIGLHVSSAALAQPDPLASRPEWVSEEDLALLTRLEIDPQADLETKAEHHWRWRTSHILSVGDFVCPPGSAIDLSRTIKVIIAAEGKVCRNIDFSEVDMLKLNPDGSARPLGE